MASSTHHSRGLIVVAILKLVEGTLLVLLAAGALHMMGRDLAQTVETWAREVRVDPENRYLAGLLAKASLVDDRQLKQLGGLTLIYAALFFTEGIGLLLRKRWAEYLTVIATASLIPLEIYEFCGRPSVMKGAVLAGNVAIVIYLIAVLRKNARSDGVK